jgi:hypothetical protein
MNFAEQLSAITLLIAFLFGVTFGVVGGASRASRREDRNYSLPRTAPDPLSAGARVIHRVYIRGNRFVSGAPGNTERASIRSRGDNDDSGVPGKESRL